MVGETRDCASERGVLDACLVSRRGGKQAMHAIYSHVDGAFVWVEKIALVPVDAV